MYTATLLRTKVLLSYFRTFISIFVFYLRTLVQYEGTLYSNARCQLHVSIRVHILYVYVYCTRTCSFFKFIKIYFSTETTEIHQKDPKNSPCCNRISRSRINARIIINNMSERKAVIKNADMSEVYPNISRVVVFKFGRNKMFIPVLDSSGSPGKKRVCASILHAQPPLPNLFLWIVLF